MKKSKKSPRGITLIALVITIVILLILVGVAIGTLGGENGLISKVNQAKKIQIKAEMKEKLILAISKLQTEKEGKATLDDITQEWANNELDDYETKITTDPTLNEKKIKMTKSNITGKFLIDEKLRITDITKIDSSIELTYEVKGRIENKVKISIDIQDNENGLSIIEFPDGEIIECFGRTEYVKDNYEIEIGQEYKIKITSKNGEIKEETILISDYWYNITKNLGNGIELDNPAIKTAYNKPYEVILTMQAGYGITELTVTMEGQTITTSGNNIVDITTGRIYIDKVTGDIEITVKTKIDQDSLLKSIIIKPSTTEWTNKNIQVEVEWGYNNTDAKKEISIDGGTSYKQYTDAFEIEKNTTIIAKMTVGEIEVTKELPITNIDKLEPKDFTPTIYDLVSSTEFTINANALDAEATEEYGSSGIKEYQYYVYKGAELIDKSEKITNSIWNVSGLTVGDSYDIYVEVWDNVGKYKKSEVISYTKLEVYVWEKYKANSETKMSPDICIQKENYYKTKVNSDAIVYYTNNPNVWNVAAGFYNLTATTVNNLKIGTWYNEKSSSTWQVWYLTSKVTNTDGTVTLYGDRMSTLRNVTTYTNSYELLEYAKSNNSSQYPEDGAQGGYWYKKID